MLLDTSVTYLSGCSDSCDVRGLYSGAHADFAGERVSLHWPRDVAYQSQVGIPPVPVKEVQRPPH